MDEARILTAVCTVLLGMRLLKVGRAGCQLKARGDGGGGGGVQQTALALAPRPASTSQDS
jgi:hypothetical protein